MDYGLKSAAGDLSLLLRKARSKAIREKREVVITFEFKEKGNKTDGWYVFDAGNISKRTIPAAGSLGAQYGGGVHFGFGKAKKGASTTGKLPAVPVSFQSNKIQFNPMGLCTSGYVYLSNKKGTAIAVGANSTGVIMYKQWNGSAWQ
jgi:Tfp pilus assembly protein FimT